MKNNIDLLKIHQEVANYYEQIESNDFLEELKDSPPSAILFEAESTRYFNYQIMAFLIFVAFSMNYFDFIQRYL